MIVARAAILSSLGPSAHHRLFIDSCQTTGGRREADLSRAGPNQSSRPFAELECTATTHRPNRWHKGRNIRTGLPDLSRKGLGCRRQLRTWIQWVCCSNLNFRRLCQVFAGVVRSTPLRRPNRLLDLLGCGFARWPSRLTYPDRFRDRLRETEELR